MPESGYAARAAERILEGAEVERRSASTEIAVEPLLRASIVEIREDTFDALDREV